MERLGQHFLKNKKAIKKIAAALNLQPKDIVIEIGPGHGELTGELLALRFKLLDKKRINGPKILAIEKDAELVKLLKEKFAGEKNVKIVEGDVLKILKNLPKSKILNPKSLYKIVGNIPFYISGFLFRTLGELKNKPEAAVLTIQKEVALRLVAGPPRTNRLAASVRFWAEPKILFTIPKTDFRPIPKVDAAVVNFKIQASRLRRGFSGQERFKIDEKKYYKTVRALFAQPRKTILNNLEANRREKEKGERESKQTKEEIAKNLEAIGINPASRPQDLNIDNIIKISRLI